MSKPDRFMESLENRRMMDGGTIRGFVHNDVNGSGIIDENALPPRTTLYLDVNENGRRDSGERTTQTAVNGAYEFTNLAPGSHHVRVDYPDGWFPTTGPTADGAVVIFGGGSGEHYVGTMMIRYGLAPWGGVGQNAQHDGISPFRGSAFSQAQAVTQEATTTSNPDAGFKFGTPLFTKYNTVIIPVLVETEDEGTAFAIRAFSRAAGRLLWTFVSDFVPPPGMLRSSAGGLSQEGVAAIFQPAIDAQGRVYVPGAGGTVHMIGAPDRFGFTKPGQTFATIGSKRLVFYGKENYLESNNKPGEKAKRYRKTLFINTGLTVDDAGNVYFGVTGKKGNFNPLQIGSSLAKVNANGRGARVNATVLTGCTPALSRDDGSVYVVTQEESQGKTTPKLERFAAGSLARTGFAVLKDPSRPNKAAVALDQGRFVMPTVAPDGDVYYVIPGTQKAQTDFDNGFLLRFSPDLKKQKMSALASTSQTVAIVPTSMIPGYRGRSTYFIAATYAHSGGATLAVLDPSQAAATKQSGINVMKSLKSIEGPRWLSRPVTVDPSSNSIFAVDSETRLVRWNVSDASDVGNVFTLGNANQSYDPAVTVAIGPDGQVYTCIQGALYTAF